MQRCLLTTRLIPVVAFLFFAMCLALLSEQSLADDKQKDAPVVPPRQGKRETIKLFSDQRAAVVAIRSLLRRRGPR
jgi:hypothetical protein